jgi:hypothetical protein
MKNFLRALLVAAALATSGYTAGAQAAAPPSPEALQAARDLVALVSAQTIADMTSNVTAKVWPQLAAALRQRYPKIDDATLGELRAAYEGLVSDTVKEAMAEAPTIYARYFTAAEMKDIAAFYRTPTGTKALSVMPKVTGDLVPILIPRMQAVQQKIGPAFAAILQKHGYQTEK